MGGPGSGNRWCSGRVTVESYHRLDVRRLHRDGYLMPGVEFSWHWSRGGVRTGWIGLRVDDMSVTLTYRSRTIGGEWKPIEYTVLIDRTPCTFGGSRPWFLCPARGCGRRVAVLYGGAVFACRQCHRLAYDSQSEDAASRAMRRAGKVRARLGWGAGIANPTGTKPKWMRWKTYQRLCGEHDAHADRSMAEMLALPIFRGLISKR